jgi:hypothetical protein
VRLLASRPNWWTRVSLFVWLRGTQTPPPRYGGDTIGGDPPTHIYVFLVVSFF